MSAARRRIFPRLAVIAIFVLIGVIGFSRFFTSEDWAAASASGPSPSHTNAPSEGNCTSCHSDHPLNSGPGNVTLTGLPPNYRPGQQIPLTFRTSQADAIVYGFQMTVIDNQGRRVGTYTLPPQNPQQLQVVSGFVGPNERRYIEHTISGIIPTEFGFKEWTFTWNAPAQRVGRVSFYFAGNAANSDGGTSGDYIYASAKHTLSGSAISSFDGDGLSDAAVVTPSGLWSSINTTNGGKQNVHWGTSGDKIAPGDYDGDGKTDHAVFRPSIGTWYLLQSTAGFSAVQFGSNDDVPVPGDYDGDLKTDIAVFRPADGAWYVLRSTQGFYGLYFGLNDDKPVQGDFDADAKTDIAVFRPSNGAWYIQASTAGFSAALFGTNGDRPVQGDYDGDGRHDFAVFRPSTGVWYLFQSTAGFAAAPFGISTDRPVPADYDGDGKTDIAVYRNGLWYILRSLDGNLGTFQLGQSADTPVPAGYIAE